MKIYTTGYEKKSAREFFEPLRRHAIECIIDIRLYPDGPAEGFARRTDLDYLLEMMLGCEYRYCSLLAPTPEMLDEYHRQPDWPGYVTAYHMLMEERDIPAVLDRRLFEQKKCCLLCFEASPEQCHRRLAAERIARVWEDTEIIHI